MLGLRAWPSPLTLAGAVCAACVACACAVWVWAGAISLTKDEHITSDLASAGGVVVMMRSLDLWVGCPDSLSTFARGCPSSVLIVSHWAALRDETLVSTDSVGSATMAGWADTVVPGAVNRPALSSEDMSTRV